MANKKLWLGILVTVLVFGMAVVGCEDDKGGGGEKTLIVQNVPSNVFTLASSQGGLLGVFPVGTTIQQAESMTGIVAGADLSNYDIIVVGSGPYTLTIPLYNINNNNRWTGSGTYDIYVEVGYWSPRYFKASSVNISSGTTTISFSSATEVYP